MAVPPNPVRLSVTERLTIVGLSLGFALAVSFIGYILVFTSLPTGETAWDFYQIACRKTLIAFWDGVSQGRIRTAGGILLGGFAYLVVFPLLWLASLFGILTGLRGKRTRFATRILQRALRDRGDAQTAPAMSPSPCASCFGRGFQWVPLAKEAGQVQLTCPVCHGTGREP
jgi:hypothetical protein